MTNADKIRQMSDEELLEFLYGIPNSCILERCDNYEDCLSCWQAWLGEEADGSDCSDGSDGERPGFD